MVSLNGAFSRYVFEEFEKPIQERQFLHNVKTKKNNGTFTQNIHKIFPKNP